MKILQKLSISNKRQSQISRGMQLSLILAVLGGFYLGNTGIIVNSFVGLLITFVPSILERDYEITMNPLLVLWITSAVFFHAIGTYGPYRTVSWWDHFTHLLSSSVVAAAGYSTVRALDQHYDEISLPKKAIFVFILVFVMAFGVIWEVLEFGISGAAELLGSDTVLTQYGLEDTMKDLVFDTFGGLIVALTGEIYLVEFSDEIRSKLEKK